MSHQQPTTYPDEDRGPAVNTGPEQGMQSPRSDTTNHRVSLSKPGLSRGFRVGAIVLACFAGLTLIGGLVAGLLIPTINATGQARAKARSAAGLMQLAQAVRAYSGDHGSAPESREALARLVPRYMSSYPMIGPDTSTTGEISVQSAEQWLAQSEFSYVALGDLSSLAHADTAMMLFEKPGLWKRGGGHVAYADGHVQYISGLRFDELVQGIEAAQGQSKPR